MLKYKGFFTVDHNATYFHCRPVYYGNGYFKAKITFYYKSESLNGIPLQKGNYKIYYKNVTHWKRYDPKSF